MRSPRAALLLAAALLAASLRGASAQYNCTDAESIEDVYFSSVSSYTTAFTLNIAMETATVDAGVLLSSCADNTARSRWFTLNYTLDLPSYVFVSTCAGDDSFDTTISVHDACPTAGVTNEVACNDDTAADTCTAAEAGVQFVMMPGTMYYIRMASKEGTIAGGDLYRLSFSAVAKEGSYCNSVAQYFDGSACQPCPAGEAIVNSGQESLSFHSITDAGCAPCDNGTIFVTDACLPCLSDPEGASLVSCADFEHPRVGDGVLEQPCWSDEDCYYSVSGGAFSSVATFTRDYGAGRWLDTPEVITVADGGELTQIVNAGILGTGFSGRWLFVIGFYDALADTSSSREQYITFQSEVAGGATMHVGFGVHGSTSGTSYSIYDGGWMITSTSRSLGWHTLTIDLAAGKYYLDGAYVDEAATTISYPRSVKITSAAAASTWSPWEMRELASDTAPIAEAGRYTARPWVHEGWTEVWRHRAHTAWPASADPLFDGSGPEACASAGHSRTCRGGVNATHGGPDGGPLSMDDYEVLLVDEQGTAVRFRFDSGNAVSAAFWGALAGGAPPGVVTGAAWNGEVLEARRDWNIDDASWSIAPDSLVYRVEDGVTSLLLASGQCLTDAAVLSLGAPVCGAVDSGDADTYDTGCTGACRRGVGPLAQAASGLDIVPRETRGMTVYVRPHGLGANVATPRISRPVFVSAQQAMPSPSGASSAPVQPWLGGSIFSAPYYGTTTSGSDPDAAYVIEANSDTRVAYYSVNLKRPVRAAAFVAGGFPDEGVEDAPPADRASELPADAGWFLEARTANDDGTTTDWVRVAAAAPSQFWRRPGAAPSTSHAVWVDDDDSELGTDGTATEYRFVFPTLPGRSGSGSSFGLPHVSLTQVRLHEEDCGATPYLVQSQKGGIRAYGVGLAGRSSSGFSLAAWMLIDENQSPVRSFLATGTAGTAGSGYRLKTANRGVCFWPNGDGWSACVPDNTLQTGVWTHVAAVSNEDGNAVTLYLNGTAMATGTGGTAVTITPATQDYWVNEDTDLVGSGEVAFDDMRVYERPLTASEVFLLATLQGPQVSDTELVLHLEFDDPSDGVVRPNGEQVFKDSSPAGVTVDSVPQVEAIGAATVMRYDSSSGVCLERDQPRLAEQLLRGNPYGEARFEYAPGTGQDEVPADLNMLPAGVATVATLSGGDFTTTGPGSLAVLGTGGVGNSESVQLTVAQSANTEQTCTLEASLAASTPVRVFRYGASVRVESLTFSPGDSMPAIEIVGCAHESPSASGVFTCGITDTDWPVSVQADAIEHGAGTSGWVRLAGLVTLPVGTDTVDGFQFEVKITSSDAGVDLRLDNFFVLAGYQDGDDNLLANPGFEYGLGGWEPTDIGGVEGPTYRSADGGLMMLYHDDDSLDGFAEQTVTILGTDVRELHASVEVGGFRVPGSGTTARGVQVTATLSDSSVVQATTPGLDDGGTRTLHRYEVDLPEQTLAITSVTFVIELDIDGAASLGEAIWADNAVLTPGLARPDAGSTCRVTVSPAVPGAAGDGTDPFTIRAVLAAGDVPVVVRLLADESSFRVYEATRGQFLNQARVLELRGRAPGVVLRLEMAAAEGWGAGGNETVPVALVGEDGATPAASANFTYTDWEGTARSLTLNECGDEFFRVHLAFGAADTLAVAGASDRITGASAAVPGAGLDCAAYDAFGLDVMVRVRVGDAHDYYRPNSVSGSLCGMLSGVTTMYDWAPAPLADENEFMALAGATGDKANSLLGGLQPRAAAGDVRAVLGMIGGADATAYGACCVGSTDDPAAGAWGLDAEVDVLPLAPAASGRPDASFAREQERESLERVENAGAENLLQNGGFERSTPYESWTYFQSSEDAAETVEVDQSYASVHTGFRSLRVSQDRGAEVTLQQSVFLPYLAGTHVFVDVWVLAELAGDLVDGEPGLFGLAVSVMGESQDSCYETATVRERADGWERLTCLFETPLDGVAFSADVRLFAYGALGTVWFDSASMRVARNPESPNLVINPGFELGAAAWDWDDTCGNVNGGLVDDSSASGARGTVMELQKEHPMGGGCFVQTVAVAQSVPRDLMFRFRAATYNLDVSGAAPASGLLAVLNFASGETRAEQVHVRPGTSGEFLLYERLLRIDQPLASVTLQIKRNDMTGRLEIDDVELTEMPEVVRPVEVPVSSCSESTSAGALQACADATGFAAEYWTAPHPTGWLSASGDKVGAWIELAWDEAVPVCAIEWTPRPDVRVSQVTALFGGGETATLTIADAAIVLGAVETAGPSGTAGQDEWARLDAPQALFLTERVTATSVRLTVDTVHTTGHDYAGARRVRVLACETGPWSRVRPDVPLSDGYLLDLPRDPALGPDFFGDATAVVADLTYADDLTRPLALFGSDCADAPSAFLSNEATPVWHYGPRAVADSPSMGPPLSPVLTSTAVVMIRGTDGARLVDGDAVGTDGATPTAFGGGFVDTCSFTLGGKGPAVDDGKNWPQDGAVVRSFETWRLFKGSAGNVALASEALVRPHLAGRDGAAACEASGAGPYVALNGTAGGVALPAAWGSPDPSDTGVSVALWARRDGSPGTLYSHRIGDASCGAALFLAYADENTVTAGWVNETDLSALGTAAVFSWGAYRADTAEWHHWAASWSHSSGVSLYRDGVLVASEAAPTLNAACAAPFDGDAAVGGVAVAAAAGTQYETFAGAVDEVILFERVVSPFDVSAVYMGRADDIYQGDDPLAVWFCDSSTVDLAGRTTTGTVTLAPAASVMAGNLRDDVCHARPHLASGACSLGRSLRLAAFGGGDAAAAGLSFDAPSDVYAAASGSGLTLEAVVYVSPAALSGGGDVWTYPRMAVVALDGGPWRLAVENGQALLELDGLSPAYSVSPAGMVPAGVAVHVTVTVDASYSTVRWYADGHHQSDDAGFTGGALTAPGSPDDLVLRVGGSSEPGFAPLEGAVDEVRLWEGVLAGSAVEGLALRPVPDVHTAGDLRVYLAFDEDEGHPEGLVTDRSLWPGGLVASLAAVPDGRASIGDGACGTELCNAGRYADTGSSCDDCPEGTFSGSLTFNATACVECAPGTFQSTLGSTVCDNCTAGFFSAGTAAQSCDPCGAGTFSADGSAACTDCPAGTSQASIGESACGACVAGKFSLAGASVCQPCAVGTFSAAAGASVCANCTAGTFQASTDKTVCDACPAGKFSPAGASVCQDCGVGTFAAAAGASLCDDCPAGTFQAAPAKTECDDCPAGRFRPNTGTSTCMLCPAGYFSDTDGASACDACAAGTFQASTDKTVCDACPAGAVSAAAAATVCDDCAAGTFAASGGLTECDECAAGSVARSAGADSCDACATADEAGMAVCPFGAEFTFASPLDGAAAVSVASPVFDADLAVSVGSPPLEISFAVSEIGDIAGGNWYVAAQGDPDGAVEGTDSVLNRTFATPGVFRVAVTLFPNGVHPGMPPNRTAYAWVRVNAPPVVVATASPSAGVAPLEVTLDASGTTDDELVDVYFFDFGDGTNATSFSPVVTHVYRDAGTYSPAVRAGDNLGAASAPLVLGGAVTVNLRPAASLAVASGELVGVAPLSIETTGAASSDPDGSIAAYQWLWGDGSAAASGVEGAHTYSTPGTYEVELRVTDNNGAAAFAYATVIALEEVLVDPAPTPVLVSAQFSASVTTLALTFAEATDLAGASFGAPAACASVLAESTLEVLGESPSCRWRDARTLAVVMGAGATVALGDDVATRAGALKSADGTSLPAARLVAAATAPAAVPPVAAVLQAPSDIGTCAGVTLSAEASTGNAGRPLEFVWRLESTPGSASLTLSEQQALAAALAAAPASGRVELDADLLPPSVNYTFSVTASSWVGGSATAQRVVRKSGLEIPTVSVAGASVRDVRRDRALTLSALAEVQACGNDSAVAASVAYSWRQVVSQPELASRAEEVDAGVTLDGPVVTSASGAGTRALVLPPNALGAGLGYAFQVTATLMVGGSAAGSSSAYVGVRVAQSPLVARVEGGDRLVSRSASAASAVLSLSGAGSEDPDAAAGSLAFAWTCERAADASACFSPADEAAHLVDAAGIEVPVPLLGETSDAAGGAYVFRLVVSKDVRASEAAEVRISTTPDVVPVVAVRPQEDAKHNPTRKLVLAGVPPPVEDSVGGAYTYAWTCTSGNLDLAAEGVLASSSAAGRNLALRAGALEGGATYSFEFAVTDAGTGKTGTAGATVVTNAAPTSGLCEASPSSGHAFQTVFRLACRDWTDDPDDTPLEYAFRLRRPDGGADSLLRAFGPDTGLETDTLPQGAEARGHNHTVVGVVRDALGATVEYEFQVQVLPPVLDDGEGVDDFADDLVDGSIAAAAEAGDTEALARSVFAVAALLDSDGTGDAGSGEAAERRQALRGKLLDGVRAASNRSAYVSADSLMQRVQLVDAVTVSAGAAELSADVQRDAVSLVGDALATAVAGASNSTEGLGAEEAASMAASAFSAIGSVAAAAAASAGKVAAAVPAALEGELEDRADLADAIVGSLGDLSRVQSTGAAPGEEPAVLESDDLRVASRVEYAGDYGGATVGGDAGGFALPDGGALAAIAGGDDEEVLALFFESSANVYAWAGGTMASPVMSLSFAPRGGGDELSVSGLDSPIRVTLPLVAGETFAANERAGCRWWSASSRAWDGAGCKIDEASSTSEATVCLCTHLTAFGAAKEEFTPEGEGFGAGDVTALTWANLMEHPTTLIAVVVMCLIYAAMLPFAMRKDRRHTRRVQALASYREGDSVDDIVHRLWSHKLNGSGSGEDDEELLGAVPGAGSAGDSKWARFKAGMRRGVREDHTWVSVALRRPTDTFTSVQRLTVVLGIVLGTMAFNAFFFANDQRTGAALLVAFLSSVCVIPFTFFFAVLFQRAGPDPEVPLRLARLRYRAYLRRTRKVDAWNGTSSGPSSPRGLGAAGEGAAAAPAPAAAAAPTPGRLHAVPSGASQADVEMGSLESMPGSVHGSVAGGLDTAAAAPASAGGGPRRLAPLPAGPAGSGAASSGGGGGGGGGSSSSSSSKYLRTNSMAQQRPATSPRSAKSLSIVREEGASDKRARTSLSAGEVAEAPEARGWWATFRLPAWFVYVGYALVCVYLVSCVFICLVMGLKFDREHDETGEGEASAFGADMPTSGVWIISSFIGILQDVLLNQPLGVALTSVLTVCVGNDFLVDLAVHWHIHL